MEEPNAFHVSELPHLRMGDSDSSYRESDEESSSGEESGEEGTSTDTDCEIKYKVFPRRAKRWPIGEWEDRM